jgi:cytochrome c556
VPAHARAIQALAPTIPDMFPEGSTQPASRALPAIWENFEDFRSHASTLERLGGELVTTSEAGDPQATLAAFTQMGREGCGGCHNDYREKRD